MAEEQRTIVVCGATGKQGGAVLESLLKNGDWKVTVVARNPESDRARDLRSRGIEVRQADLLDRGALTKAFAGAYGVYGVTTPETPEGKIDTAMEKVQGLNIADACVANGIQHLVLSTVMLVEEGQAERLSYIRAKFEIERHVESLGIPYTFLRPGSFMDELGGAFLPVKKGVITGQCDNDAKVPYVACRDIGHFAAMAFADRERFAGQGLNLIGDFISGDELARVATEISGRTHRHKVPPIFLMRIFARQWIPLRRQFEAWGRPPFPPALLEALEEGRRMHPKMLTFEGYLRATGYGSTPDSAPS